MIKITFTDVFIKWVAKLKDRQARAIINHHLDRIVEGNFGRTRFVGDGVYEKKINYAGGYLYTIFCVAKIG